MSDIRTHVNPDVKDNAIIPVQGNLQFIDGKLYQYQWSYADGELAWYLVSGQLLIEVIISE